MNDAYEQCAGGGGLQKELAQGDQLESQQRMLGVQQNMSLALDALVDNCTEHILIAYADAKASWLDDEASQRAAASAEEKYDECAAILTDAQDRAAEAEGVRNELQDESWERKQLIEEREREIATLEAGVRDVALLAEEIAALAGRAERANAAQLLQEVDDIVAQLLADDDELVSTDLGDEQPEDDQPCVTVIDEAIRTCDGGIWFRSGIVLDAGDMDTLRADLETCRTSLAEGSEAAANAAEQEAGWEGCESDFAAHSQACTELRGNYTSLNMAKFNYDDVEMQTRAYEELSADLIDYQAAVTNSNAELTELMDTYRQKIEDKWNLDEGYDELQLANEACEQQKEAVEGELVR